MISYSEDEGKHYTAPAPIIDTPLDDRDAGILAFGDKGVMVTSFNNAVSFQKEHAGRHGATQERRDHLAQLFAGYLGMVTEEEEKRYLGSEFCISQDGGVTFGPLYHSPVTSPHGPCLLRDGSILWVGRTFNAYDYFAPDTKIMACRVMADGRAEEVGIIPHVMAEGKRLDLCEPYAIELPDGKIICHLRAQRYAAGDAVYFTTYQSESADGGKTWSEPHPILAQLMRDLIAQGADGFYIGGATGEGLALRPAERERLTEASVAIGRAAGLPCIIQIASTDLSTAVQLAKHAEAQGAAALSATAPVFFSYSADDVWAYYQKLASAVHIPVMVYYNPAAKFPMDAPFGKRLFEIDNVTSIKWISSDFYQMMLLKELTNGEMDIINGCDEMLLMGLCAGADGGIGTTYNYQLPYVKWGV